MYTPYYSCSVEDLSVEANSDKNQVNDFLGIPILTSELDLLFEDNIFGNIDVSGTCDENLLTESTVACTEPDEFAKYFPEPSLRFNSTSEIDQDLIVLPTIPAGSIRKTKEKSENKKIILLSSSVGVGAPQKSSTTNHRIEIVHSLEEKYRPRYKTDYFAINGRTRRPRYVADRLGNHFISLKVPTGIHGQIRIDWVTLPDENSTRYIMPYRFQVNNDSSDVLDCNPILEPIICDNIGIMKIYLVLIKAKQDALKSLQPLQAFQPFRDVLGFNDKDNSEKTIKLTPKQLIQKYQLGKSQLAFTLCPIGSDGHICHPEWDTTVYSTVLEEETNESSAAKTVSCPNCSYPIVLNDEIVICPETSINKRKKSEVKPQQPALQTKKSRILPHEILPLRFD